MSVRKLRDHGVETEVHDGTARTNGTNGADGANGSGASYVELVADLGEETPFRYRIEPLETALPVYGDRSHRSEDFYYRLDVHLREGGQGYDVMGYTYSQLIDDVLDQYEQHMEFMRLNAEATR